MPEDANILREIAAEYDGTAKAKAEFARMADSNARGANLPAAKVSEFAQAASKARLDVTFYEARAAAARAGASALEGGAA